MNFLFILLPTIASLASGKLYDRCSLANELITVHGAPIHQVATWVCIAEHESSYRTDAVGRLGENGTADHGLFQISDKYWCSPPGTGQACRINCAQLEDDDITDDFICAQKIYREHKGISGDGFNAWVVYKPYCKGSKAKKYLKGCFGGSNRLKPSNFEKPTVFNRPFESFNTGNAYNQRITDSSEKPAIYDYYTRVKSVSTVGSSPLYNLVSSKTDNYLSANRFEHYKAFEQKSFHHTTSTTGRTSNFPAITASPPYSTSIPPYSNSNPFNSRTVSPYSTTISPYSTYNPPSSNSIPPYANSNPLNSRTISPYSTSHSPYSTTISPYSNSIPPYSNSNPPKSRTVSTYSTTISPYSSTSPPYSNSNPLNFRTISPYSTTTSPFSSTNPPYSNPIPSYSTSVPPHSKTTPPFSTTNPFLPQNLRSKLVNPTSGAPFNSVNYQIKNSFSFSNRPERPSKISTFSTSFDSVGIDSGFEKTTTKTFRPLFVFNGVRWY